MAPRKQIHKASRKVNYVKAVVIAHGKSEVLLSEYIKTHLHLNIKIYAKDHGSHSIQISSLMKEHLNKKTFSTMEQFLLEYEVETSGTSRNKKLVDFKLFIIMDTDDCKTEQQKQDFLSGAMFQEHWLAPYIVPIYFIENFEHVTQESGIASRRIKSSEKGTYYSKIFPINKKPLSDDTIHEITTLKEKLAVSVRKKKTNLTEFIDYCLDHVQSC